MFARGPVRELDYRKSHRAIDGQKAWFADDTRGRVLHVAR